LNCPPKIIIKTANPISNKRSPHQIINESTQDQQSKEKRVLKSYLGDGRGWQLKGGRNPSLFGLDRGSHDRCPPSIDPLRWFKLKVGADCFGENGGGKKNGPLMNCAVRN